MLKSIILLALQASNLPTAEPTCRPVDSAVVRQHVTKIIVDPDSREATLNIGALLNYWRNQCQSSRHNASEETVRALAALLSSPPYIFNASRMLSEVGENLRYATQNIEEALESDIAFRRNLRDRQLNSYPYLTYNSGTGDTNPNALRCILNKALTGMCDVTLCEQVAEANREEDN